MIAPELEGLDRPGRPGHQEGRGRRRNRALFVYGDFRLVHSVVDSHVVRVSGQRRQVNVSFEYVSDSHLLQQLKKNVQSSVIVIILYHELRTR